MKRINRLLSIILVMIMLLSSSVNMTASADEAESIGGEEIVAAEKIEEDIIDTETAEAPSVVTERGMQFRIENLQDVKSIRYAYGEYETEKDIKYGEGSVSHSAKTLRTRGNSCVLQFPKPGLVSIVITYNDGTRDFHKYEVIKSSPTVTRDGGNSITFSDLSDLKVLRYVKGEYENSYDIKRASDSVAISGKTLNSDTYTVSLDRETYTFCVQYNDESYNYYVTGICGDNLTWVYDMQSATLTVSGEGKMYNYHCQKEPWDEYLSEIKNITFEPGITQIGISSFIKCTSIESLIIPDSVIKIQAAAFEDCSNLKSVVIGDGVTEIWGSAFENCTSLTDVIFGKNIEMIGDNAFKKCRSLHNINLPRTDIFILEDAFIGTGYFKNKQNWENGLLYLDSYLLATEYSEPYKEKIKSIVIKEGTTCIAGCALIYICNVDYVYLPRSLRYIYSFPTCDDTVYMVYNGSYAHEHVIKYNLKYQIIPEDQ